MRCLGFSYAFEFQFKWTECLEQGGQIDVMYSDFEKAFDKVSHDRLIYKLKLYGFSNDIITWIQDFLKENLE